MLGLLSYLDDMEMERRVGFDEWKNHVDNRLDIQDSTLSGIKENIGDVKTNLDAHIETTKQLRLKVEPVAEAMQTMKAGIKVIGWLGSKVSALIAAALTFFGALTAWHTWYK